MKLKNRSTVFRLTFLGFNLALYIALSFLTIRLQYQEITFKGLPVIFASIVGGPIDGIFVATFGEFINQVIGPYGLTPTTPLWILPHVVRALIVGLMMRNKNPQENRIYWGITVVISGLAVTLVNSGVIYVDALIFEYPAALTFLTIIIRAATGITVSIVYAIVIPLLLRPLQKLNKFEIKKDS